MFAIIENHLLFLQIYKYNNVASQSIFVYIDFHFTENLCYLKNPISMENPPLTLTTDKFSEKQLISLVACDL